MGTVRRAKRNSKATPTRRRGSVTARRPAGTQHRRAAAPPLEERARDWRVVDEAPALDLLFWAYQKAQDEWISSGAKTSEAAARILHALFIALDERDPEALRAPNEWATEHLRARAKNRSIPHGTLDRSVDGRLEKKADAARAFVGLLSSRLAAYEVPPMPLAVWFWKTMRSPMGAKLFAPVPDVAGKALLTAFIKLRAENKHRAVEDVFVRGLAACGMPLKQARNLAESVFRNS